MVSCSRRGEEDARRNTTDSVWLDGLPEDGAVQSGRLGLRRGQNCTARAIPCEEKSMEATVRHARGREIERDQEERRGLAGLAGDDESRRREVSTPARDLRGLVAREREGNKREKEAQRRGLKGEETPHQLVA